MATIPKMRANELWLTTEPLQVRVFTGDDARVTVSIGGFSNSVTLSREEAIKLRDYLGAELGEE